MTACGRNFAREARALSRHTCAQEGPDVAHPTDAVADVAAASGTSGRRCRRSISFFGAAPRRAGACARASSRPRASARGGRRRPTRAPGDTAGTPCRAPGCRRNGRCRGCSWRRRSGDGSGGGCGSRNCSSRATNGVATHGANSALPLDPVVGSRRRSRRRAPADVQRELRRALGTWLSAVGHDEARRRRRARARGSPAGRRRSGCSRAPWPQAPTPTPSRCPASSGTTAPPRTSAACVTASSRPTNSTRSASRSAAPGAASAAR